MQSQHPMSFSTVSTNEGNELLEQVDRTEGVERVESFITSRPTRAIGGSRGGKEEGEGKGKEDEEWGFPSNVTSTKEVEDETYDMVSIFLCV